MVAEEIIVERTVVEGIVVEGNMVVDIMVDSMVEVFGAFVIDSLDLVEQTFVV